MLTHIIFAPSPLFLNNMEMALSLRNNRTFGAELVMPMNAIALDNDEMEYVEGGGTISLTLSKAFLSDCIDYGCSAALGVIGGLLGNLLGPVGAIVFGGIGAVLGGIIGGVISRNCVTSAVHLSYSNFLIPFNWSYTF